MFDALQGMCVDNMYVYFFLSGKKSNNKGLAL